MLGAQGARALRGGKMDDVIFAGTADRPALGRAEVSLTIDNTSQLLPIEFSEVTITRTLFRTGESEYMINGAPCRLLDIQELLSDTGIGRQQHVIVGQGQLDAVLNARPEDRRAIIEEAAGILKFRKRREKAQRRLEATEGNLLRLTDLLREVRRQLRPLERQADARAPARRPRRRAPRDHAAPRGPRARHSCGCARSAAERQRGELADEEQELRVRLRTLDDGVLEAEHALAIPGDDDVADLLDARRGLARAQPRTRRTSSPSGAAGSSASSPRSPTKGVVETLVAEAASVREQLTAVDADFATLAPTRAEVEAAEARVAELQKWDGFDAPSTPSRHAAERDLSQAEQRERTLGAELDAVREQSRTGRTGAVRARPATGRSRVAPRQTRANVRAELEAHTSVAAELTRSGAGARHGRTTIERGRGAAAGRRGHRDALGAPAPTRSPPRSKTHAADGGRRLAGGVDGVVGPLVDHIEIEAGTEVAVAAALGDALHAVVVDGDSAARARSSAASAATTTRCCSSLGSTVTTPAPLPRRPARDRWPVAFACMTGLGTGRARCVADAPARAVRARRRGMGGCARHRAGPARPRRGHARGRSLRRAKRPGGRAHRVPPS